MKKTLILASLLAAVALSACGKKAEAPAPVAPAPVVAPAAVSTPEAVSAPVATPAAAPADAMKK